MCTPRAHPSGATPPWDVPSGCPRRLAGMSQTPYPSVGVIIISHLIMKVRHSCIANILVAFHSLANSSGREICILFQTLQNAKIENISVGFSYLLQVKREHSFRAQDVTERKLTCRCTCRLRRGRATSQYVSSSCLANSIPTLPRRLAKCYVASLPLRLTPLALIDLQERPECGKI